MTKTTIVVCRDPHSLNRQLVPLLPAIGTITLIGWRQTPEPVDDGMPIDVAMMMARAFTSVARVTFLGTFEVDVIPKDWSLLNEDFVRAVRKPGLAGRVQQFTDHIPYNAVLTSTRRPETAVRLFDDPGFPWWLQGQIVLLSSPEAAPPPLDGNSVISLLDNSDCSRQGEIFSNAGILGIVRPGVDGDVAGLLALTPSVEAELLSTLENESVRAGFEWAILCKDAFSECLAGDSSH